MAKPPPTSNTPPEAVISIIGAGMTLDGDSETDGSLRVEGTIRGNVRAGKSVVIGKDGLVDGSIFTQDAVVAGRVSGGIHAVSRLELLATSEVSGEIEAPRMQVEEGAKVQGQVAVGESAGPGAFKASLPIGGAEGAAPERESKDVAPGRPESKKSASGASESGRPESDESEEAKSESEEQSESAELEAAHHEPSRD